MGRPKSVRIAAQEVPKVDGRKKGAKDDDGFAFICAVCSDFGDLLCCERCRDGFHLSCLGLDECPDDDPWLCSNCSENKVSPLFFNLRFPCSSSSLIFYSMDERYGRSVQCLNCSDVSVSTSGGFFPMVLSYGAYLSRSVLRNVEIEKYSSFSDHGKLLLPLVVI